MDREKVISSNVSWNLKHVENRNELYTDQGQLGQTTLALVYGMGVAEVPRLSQETCGELFFRLNTLYLIGAIDYEPLWNDLQRHNGLLVYNQGKEDFLDMTPRRAWWWRTALPLTLEDARAELQKQGQSRDTIPWSHN